MAQLFVSPFTPAFSTLGVVAPGATLRFYLTGTTTLATVYADDNLSTPLANPLQANIAGRFPEIYLDASVIYRAVEKDALGGIIGDADPVSNGAGGAAFLTIRSTADLIANAASKTPLFITTPLDVTSAVTITAPIADTLAQIFTATSLITIANGLPIRPEWFGPGNNGTVGKVSRACQAAAPGSTIALRVARYQSGFDTATSDGNSVADVAYLAKANITIQGARLPRPDPGLNFLTGGSVIEGPFQVHADGFAIDLVGVDSGIAVTNAVYGGAEKDGLELFQPSLGAPTYSKNNVVGHVRGLCRSATSGRHGLLFEAVDGLIIGSAESYLAGIGTVLKSSNVQAGLLAAYNCTNFGIYIKSDSYAPCLNVSIAQIVSRSVAFAAGVGMIIQAATAPCTNIKIGTIEIYNKANALMLQAEGAPLQSCRIATAVIDGCTTGGRAYGPTFGSIDNLTVLNAQNGFEIYTTISQTFGIGKLSLVNITQYGLLMQGKVSVDDVDASSVANLFRFDTAEGHLTVGHVRGDGIANMFSFSSGAMTLAGAWASVGGSEPFVYDQSAGLSRLRGKVSGGATGQLIGAMPPPLRPSAAVTRTALGFNGTVYAPIAVVIDPGGTVTAMNHTAGSTWISLDGVEWEAAA